MSKTKKKIILFSSIALLAVAIGFLIYFGTATPKGYSYEGYILAVREQNGNKVITTFYGNQQREFTVKWYTKKNFPGELKELKEGAFIQLNTAKNSNTNIRNFNAFDGYSISGKIVYMENEETPYLLTLEGAVSYYMLYSLMPTQDVVFPAESGTQITVYYQHPLNASSTKIVAEAVEQTTDAEGAFTEEELSYMKRKGYTIAN